MREKSLVNCFKTVTNKKFTCKSAVEVLKKKYADAGNQANYRLQRKNEKKRSNNSGIKMIKL